MKRLALSQALVLALPLLGGWDVFLRRDPNIEDGNKKLAAGKADDALKAYDKAAEALPDEPIVRFDRGSALFQLGKYPEAQKEFQRASESHDPQLKADAWYNMGNALYKQDRFKEALDAYKHTLGLRPEDRRAKWNLELALRKLQEQKQQQQQQQSKNDQQKKQDQKDQQQQQNQQQQQQQQNQQQQAQQDQQKQQEQQQQQQQQQQAAAQAGKNEEKPPQAPTPTDSERNGNDKDKKPQLAHKEPAREIDRQDAEAVLDALERVEPTVQKDLARRRAGNRRPSKDW
jgi:Ca-activated chloride channel family protein